MQRAIYIPPGGMIGAGSNTQAAQLAILGRSEGNGSARRRSRRKSKATSPRTRKRRSSAKRKLVKGSAEAKRFMAKLRKRRKK